MRAHDLAFDSEPRLNDMLDDPVIQAVMTRDRIARNEILNLILSMRARRDGTPAVEIAAA